MGLSPENGQASRQPGAESCRPEGASHKSTRRRRTSGFLLLTKCLLLAAVLAGLEQTSPADVSRQVEQLVLAGKWHEVRQALAEDSTTRADPVATLFKAYCRVVGMAYNGIGRAIN